MVSATALPDHRTRVPAAARAAAVSLSVGRASTTAVDLDAGGAEVGGQRVGAVVGGADDDPGTGRHGVAVEVGADRGGQHDAGAVVVRRTPAGARGRRWRGSTWAARMCQIRCRETPGAAGVQEMVGPVLGRDDVVGVVGAEGGGAVQDRALGRGDQFGLDIGHPVQGGRPFDALDEGRIRGSGQQRAAELGLVVDQDDPGAGGGGLAGRGQAGRAATDDQDVGVDVLLVVDRRGRRPGRACRAR